MVVGFTAVVSVDVNVDVVFDDAFACITIAHARVNYTFNDDGVAENTTYILRAPLHEVSVAPRMILMMMTTTTTMRSVVMLLILLCS